MRSIQILGVGLLCAVLAPSLRAQTTGDTPPSLIYRAEPEYSPEATIARVQSNVILSIVIGDDGKAHDVKVSQGAGFGLDEKAIDAMDKWRFDPATHDGHPIAAPANIEMNFNIEAKNDTEDRSGQRARLNFTLPAGVSRPELIVGKLPANPAPYGDQTLRFQLHVDAQGAPKNVTMLSSDDAAWAKIVQRVVQTWHFRPATLNGSAVAVDGVFEIEHSGPPEPVPALIVRGPAVTVEPTIEEGPAPRRVATPVNIGGLNSRSHHTATLLSNGTVLLAGGAAHQSEAAPGSNDFHSLNSTQIFDPITRIIVKTGDMLVARSNHTATLLSDGTVLIAGGHGAGPVSNAELFDPSTGKFSATGSLHEARESHSAALLPDGRVLICGGTAAGGKYLASAEIYDPRTKTFAATGTMTIARSAFHAITLKDGRVLLLGGFGTAGASAEVYDPAHGTFRAAGSMSAPRYGFSATLLEDGRVLIAGGSAGSADGPALNTAEIYDPATSSFMATGSMSQAREFQEALRLDSGKVLLSGGLPGSPGAPVAATEIYDPASGAFTPGPVLNGLHTGHTSTLLQDGTVLVAGSGLIGNGDSAELLTVK